MRAYRFSYENPMPRTRFSSRFPMLSCPSFDGSRYVSLAVQDTSMSFDPNHDMADVREHLRHARTIAPELVAYVIDRACRRFQAQHPAAKGHVASLIKSGAFADATLALLELELPQWKLRRLIFEDGEWYCALSRGLGIPVELDDMAEATHECLPLAILSAFVEAQRRSLNTGEVRPKSVPQVRASQGRALCCDNFA